MSIDPSAYKRAAYPPLPFNANRQHLTDEEVARQLDLCPNGELVLYSERRGMQVWRCPKCGYELQTVRLRQPVEHTTKRLAAAWS